MRYVCTICGYVYDEGKESVPFRDLPKEWTCPLCGAAKALFEPEQTAAAPGAVSAAAPVRMDDDMEELPAGVLAAVCSSLARGCEKQYKYEEAALFGEIADYFTAAAPPVPDAGAERLTALFRQDLEQGYPAVGGAARAEGDRGTQRVCVWGEKVTKSLHTLVQRYQREGASFLRDTSIWVCSVCGFAFVGERPPELCPVCKVPDWKFDRL